MTLAARTNQLIAAALVLAILPCGLSAASAQPPREPGTIIGMYVHQHWPYKHPYAARTWTLDDWHGYVDGLRRLGYNTVLIWPVLETMPDPLTASDRANLDRISRVIDMIHGEFGMRAYLALCPNIVADNPAAAQAPFEERHFFHCELRVNPADKDAVARMIRWREQLFRPLARTDGVFIIDSDPGGYPGSGNDEFIYLLQEHRKMFDRLRPGIELVYWVWAGWPAYGRHYATEKFEWGKPAEFEEALTLLKAMNPEPWGLAYGLEHAKKVGIESRVINLKYGAIEGEPSFPLTNYGGDAAYNAGKDLGPRGIMGNAQTHCVQLPNTFAFVRGAQGRPVTEADYVRFANELIDGQGPTIVEGWKALGGSDAAAMRAAADRLERLSGETLTPGELKGLLFGDAKRFVLDLVYELRYKAALTQFVAAANRNGDLREPLRAYLAALEAWYGRHGYQNIWSAPDAALRKLSSPEINDVLAPTLQTNTPFGRVRESLSRRETFTPQLIEAIKRTLARPVPQASSVPK